MLYLIAILIGLICGGLIICLIALMMQCLGIIDTAGDKQAEGLDGPEEW